MSIIFLDMDDVVADFSNRACEITGYTINDGDRYPKEDWDKILKYPRIYRDLDKCKDADLIVESAVVLSQKKNYELRFLTAVPRDNDFPWAFNDKIDWIRRYYPNISVWFGPYSKDKPKWCTDNSVLIDDKLQNIMGWDRAGGIGILHRNTEQTLSRIQELCSQ